MTVAVLVASNNQVSETFVRRHIDMLGSNCIVIYGGSTPFKMDGYVPSMAHKLAYRAKKVMGIASDYYDYTLAHLLKSNNVRCCFAEFGPIGVGALNACEQLGIDLIVHFHGYDAFKYDTLSEFSEKYLNLFTFAKMVISVSTAMSQQLRELGCPGDKIKYLPCLPDDNFGNGHYKNEGKSLLAVGRFVEKKAPWLTILAFNKVLVNHPDASLIMVGDGPLLPVCISLCESLKIKNVTFMGPKPHEEVVQLMLSTTIFVQHSIIASDGDREGTPVSVSEAMIAGIPVVSTKHQGIDDIIENEETGILVEENDIDGMAAAIESLLKDENKRSRLSVNSKKAMAELKSSLNESAFFQAIVDGRYIQ